jgi:aspartyl-tRNA(Asn)/glutamyl-tRNA(Gln) amidotransferase subunit A
VGKTNADEFAMGSTTETSYFGATLNPWDNEAFPGGSSGGSAAAVAIGSCLGSVGTDTGGSIRQPASHCGIAGLKPTYGLVSRYGIVPYASSLDQAGPMGRSVEDVALLLQALVAFDPKDSTSIPYTPPDYRAALQQKVSGLRLGVPNEFFVDGLEPEVEEAVQQGLKLWEKQGVKLVPISLPHTQYLISTYYIIATAEASSNLARYDGVKYGYSVRRDGSGLEDAYLATRSQGFGPEVIRRIMLGTYVLSSGYYDAYYAKASQVRTLIINDFRQAFTQVDAIAGPVVPHAALNLGQADADPLIIYLRDIYTISCNLTGLPGMSIPAGFSHRGRPIGLQLIAPRLRESSLLALGAEFQRHSDFHKQRPLFQE